MYRVINTQWALRFALVIGTSVATAERANATPISARIDAVVIFNTYTADDALSTLSIGDSLFILCTYDPDIPPSLGMPGEPYPLSTMNVFNADRMFLLSADLPGVWNVVNETEEYLSWSVLTGPDLYDCSAFIPKPAGLPGGTISFSGHGGNNFEWSEFYAEVTAYSVIPEPTTVALLGVGLVATFTIRRRRKEISVLD